MSTGPDEIEAPRLADLDWGTYADVLSEVDEIDKEARQNPEVGH